MTNLHKSSKFDLRVLSDNRVILVISILKFDFEVIRERKLVSFVEIIQHKVQHKVISYFTFISGNRQCLFLLRKF